MARTRILIAEDDVPFRMSVADILRAAGNEVTEVGSGDAALDALSTEHYDLLISDVMMPPPLGVHVAAMMRTAGTDVPVLVITASKDPEIANIVSRMKHAGLLYKPFTRADLVARVNALVEASPSGSLGVEAEV
jgi:DNA-binding response OmpR family regulator